MQLQHNRCNVPAYHGKVTANLSPTDVLSMIVLAIGSQAPTHKYQTKTINELQFWATKGHLIIKSTFNSTSLVVIQTSGSLVYIISLVT